MSESLQTAPATAPPTRGERLGQAAEGCFDLVVVGGGITGAGVAREASARGLSTLLLDRGDFAGGTSSRSSKLIHGGIRYLAQGDVALVREASRERAVLHRMAPHLAVPINVVSPARSKAGMAKLAAGMWAFRRLSADGEDYKVLGSRQTVEFEPLLAGRGIAGSVVFREYLTDDARLVLETVLSAVASGAVALNYTEVNGIEMGEAGAVLSARDVLGADDLLIRARCVVNAAGPWFDEVAGLADASQRPRLQLTRGIHVVVKGEALPLASMLALRTSDNRTAFALPRRGACYVGTTDTLYEGDPAEPDIEGADVAYLLDAVEETLGLRLRANDLLGCWAGVRPLMAAPGRKVSEISRRDELSSGPGPLVSIAGGKLTTFRRMAERVVDAAVKQADLKPSAGPPGDTPLVGGSADQQLEARAQAARLDDSELEQRLWAVYGARAPGLLRCIADDPALGEAVGGLKDLTLAELEHCVEQEMALTLDDLLRRRVRTAMFDAEAAMAAAPEVARALAVRLGWDDDRRRQEVDVFVSRTRAQISAARDAAK